MMKQQKKFIRIFNNKLREINTSIPPKKPYQSKSLQKYWDMDNDGYYSQSPESKRVVIPIRSRGCEWAMKGGGGPCTMCAVLADNVWSNDIPDQAIYRQFKKDFEKINFENKSVICLYVNGNFFDDQEIGFEVKKEILLLVSENKHIKKIVVETLPKFITKERITQYQNIAKEKKLTIGISLSSVNDFVRNVILKKGITLNVFSDAIRAINECGAESMGYVTVKPPFLSEKESIEDAIAAVQFCFKVGCQVVSLEPITVQEHTLVNFLYNKGRYKTARLWSIIDILKRTSHLGRIIIGGLVFSPIPITFPVNCDKCNERVLQSLKDFNISQKPEIFNSLTCRCKSEWKKDLQIKEMDLNERIIEMLK